jgi:hypothetical protein
MFPTVDAAVDAIGAAPPAPLTPPE